MVLTHSTPRHYMDVLVQGKVYNKNILWDYLSAVVEIVHVALLLRPFIL